MAEAAAVELYPAMPPELLGLVRAEARLVLRRLPPEAVSLEDLIGFGHLGLVEARRRFDVHRGVSFHAFARFRIRGAIFDGLRRLGLLTRRTYEDLRRQALTWRLLGEPRPDPPGEPDLAHDARTVYGAITQLATAFLAEAATPADAAPNPEEHLSYLQDLRRMRSALDDLDEEERELLKAVYDLDDTGDTGAALARRQGVNRSSVTRRHQAILDKLRQLMERQDSS